LQKEKKFIVDKFFSIFTFSYNYYYEVATDGPNTTVTIFEGSLDEV
jgi:hypothetical protein